MTYYIKSDLLTTYYFAVAENSNTVTIKIPTNVNADRTVSHSVTSYFPPTAAEVEKCNTITEETFVSALSELKRYHESITEGIIKFLAS